MRYILAPHFGQIPCIAGWPFSVLIVLGFLISLLARHVIQYACIYIPPLFSVINEEPPSKVYVADEITVTVITASAKQRMSRGGAEAPPLENMGGR